MEIFWKMTLEENSLALLCGKIAANLLNKRKKIFNNLILDFAFAGGSKVARESIPRR
jgi:hypothetical protein